MTIDEWGNVIFNKIFKVLHIDFDNGTTVVLDTLTDITYSVTYNGKTMRMELTELDDEKTT